MRLLLFVAMLSSSVALAQIVPWKVRTPSVPSTRAADPAFVSSGPSVNLFVGTDPAQTGLLVYRLDGGYVSSEVIGAARSVDSLGDVVVASAAVLQELKVYRALSNSLVNVLDGVHNVPTAAALALGREADGGLVVWIDDSSPGLRQIALTPTDGGRFSASVLGNVSLPEATGGVTVDSASSTVFVSQPNRGIIAIESGVPRYIASIDAGQLGNAIGGIDVYPLASGGSLLFTTAPSSGEIIVHRVSTAGQATWLGAFTVASTRDGGVFVQLPAHLDVFPGALPGFPQGALAVHDGVMANYALVDLADVAAAFTPPLPLGGAGGGGGSSGDGGSGTGGGGGGVIGVGVPDSGTGLNKPPPGSEPTPSGCGCTTPPLVALPALLLLWWIRRPRS